MQKTQLYYVFLLFSVTGWIWIAVNFLFIRPQEGSSSICLFRTITGIPCPSCGTTRSVQSILCGNAGDAFRENPLGFAAVSLLLAVPVWILHDFIRGKSGFSLVYRKMERAIRRKQVAIPLILSLMAFWAWHIYRHFT